MNNHYGNINNKILKINFENMIKYINNDKIFMFSHHNITISSICLYSFQEQNQIFRVINNLINNWLETPLGLQCIWPMYIFIYIPYSLTEISVANVT